MGRLHCRDETQLLTSLHHNVSGAFPPACGVYCTLLMMFELAGHLRHPLHFRTRQCLVLVIPHQLTAGHSIRPRPHFCLTTSASMHLTAIVVVIQLNLVLLAAAAASTQHGSPSAPAQPLASVTGGLRHGTLLLRCAAPQLRAVHKMARHTHALRCPLCAARSTCWMRDHPRQQLVTATSQGRPHHGAACL